MKNNFRDHLLSEKQLKRPKIPLTMTVGTKFQTLEDDMIMDIEITKIELDGMHRPKPDVIITYKYSNPKHKGTESNSLEFFVKEIIGDRLK